ISRLNLMGNLLLLSPIGFLLPICFPKIRSGQIWFLSFVFCGLIEIIQISLSIGIFDVDDIILNGLGGVLGFMMHKYMVKKYVNAGLILLFCLLILGSVYYLLFSVPFENPV
ncbi:MAG: VanZ family protein, partial [Aquirufa sp.]